MFKLENIKLLIDRLEKMGITEINYKTILFLLESSTDEELITELQEKKRRQESLEHEISELYETWKNSPSGDERVYAELRLVRLQAELDNLY